MKNCNEIVIHSLNEYINEIDNLRSQRDVLAKLPIYYRGHASATWKLQSYLFRNIGWCTQGFDLYNNSQILFPEIFKDCKTRLDKLVTMQHWGMATRLLDVSKNPLVALYFACLDVSAYLGTSTDGAVYYIQNQKPEPLEFVQICTDLLMLLIQKNYHFDVVMQGFSEQNINSYYQEINSPIPLKIILELLQTNYIFQPIHNNERIRIQQGAMIFPKTLNQQDGTYFIDNGTIDDFFEKKHFIIPQNCKKRILDELNCCGINEATLFPDAEHKLSWLRESLKIPNNDNFLKDL